MAGSFSVMSSGERRQLRRAVIRRMAGSFSAP